MIARVKAEIAQLRESHTRACRAYNACSLDMEQYRAQTDPARERLAALPEMVTALESAGDVSERLRALDALYRTMVPEQARTEEVTFHLGVTAQMPGEVGGKQMIISAGEVVPSGAKMSFSVATSEEAFVYMFHASPSGEVSVVFPEPRMATQNPLPAGKAPRIPPAGQDFLLDDKDIGVENLYLIVSRKPIDDLDAALDRYRRGQVRSMGDDPLLDKLARVGEDARAETCRGLPLTVSAEEAGECTRPRGLALASTSTDAPAGLDSMSVRTWPGDDVSVRRFPIRHVRLADYKQGSGTRGGPIME